MADGVMVVGGRGLAERVAGTCVHRRSHGSRREPWYTQFILVRVLLHVPVPSPARGATAYTVIPALLGPAVPVNRRPHTGYPGMRNSPTAGPHTCGASNHARVENLRRSLLGSVRVGDQSVHGHCGSSGGLCMVLVDPRDHFIGDGGRGGERGLFEVG